MRFDNVGYGAAIRAERQRQRLRMGDIAAAFGVSEIEVSAVENGQEPSQRFTEAAAAKLNICYSAFAAEDAINDIHQAIDIVARADVLPFPYRYRVQDDV